MFSRPIIVAALVAVASALFPVAPSTAGAMNHWYGKVTQVDDGDTFDIDIEGDGTHDDRHVRMAGIQAMELDHYGRDIGDCSARQAKRRLEALIEGKRVRLSAQHSGSSGRDRPLRFVALYSNGAWRDVGQMMIDEGHVLWFPKPEEPSHNLAYHRGADRAATRGINLWDRDRCGDGPRQGLPIRLKVQYDAPGGDRENLNGEWFKIINRGSRNLYLRGWHVRDSALRRYTFPRGAKVRPGSSIKVHVGRGTNTARHYYWGLSSPIFENPTTDGTHMGDGGYLFDPDGDLRAKKTYPCVYSC